MRKFLSLLAAFAIVFSFFNQPQQAKAATPIRVFIDGQVLQTTQPPLLIGGYTMVPLRSIFEALNAQVIWNQKAKTVTAKKRDTTIVLTIGARTATINDQTVTLDSPARVLQGSTMVPVRFVSEALGDDVRWDKLSQSVIITTKAIQQVGKVTQLGVTEVSQNGDGRDLQVSFSTPSDQANVNGYRILVVKAENVSSFNLAKALSVGAANYTSVSKSGSYQRVTLTAQSRDVDGALLRANQAYKVFVLTLGTDSNALSDSSISITLKSNPAVGQATNVKIEDISDYADGRDLRVSFSKASNESNITGYRVMIVKTSNASSFNLSQANGMSSSYYTTVAKTSGSGAINVTLNSSARDTSGDSIRNGVAYTAFVMAVSSNTANWSHSLSTGSASTTLGTSAQTPVITGVADVDDNGDGRDLQVIFNKPNDESRIGSYRIFVVREADYSSFNLTEANRVASGNYYDQYRTGSNYNITLTSNMRDTKGNRLTNGVAYRVFVMGVSNNSNYANALSVASASITLKISGVQAVTNLSVSDIADYNNGRDLQVSFTKVANESLIQNYRVFVVKEWNAGSFGLATANAVTNSSNYTTIAKKNSNIVQALAAGARDVDGATIQNGVAYRVFVMSVGTVSGSNALSSSSASIMLNNNNVTAVTNVAVSDVADYNNGQDLRVSFTKAANENNIAHYRAYVVKENAAPYFDLNSANANPNYTVIYKKNANITQELNTDSRDIDGAMVQNGIKYKVFILSVGTSTAYGNALSTASATIMLENKGTVTAVTNVVGTDVADYGNGQDLQVSFTKASVETNIGEYRVFVVPDTQAGQFRLNDANAITDSARYTRVSVGSATSLTLASGARDINNQEIKNGLAYRIFVLSVGAGAGNRVNVLSVASPTVILKTTDAPVVTGVTATVVAVTGKSTDLQVSFNKASDESNIKEYRIFVVPSTSGLTLATAINLAPTMTIEPNGANVVKTLPEEAPITTGISYQVFVLSLAKSGNSSLSSPSAPISLSSPVQVGEVTRLNAFLDVDKLIVSWTEPARTGISNYAILVVNSSTYLNETTATQLLGQASATPGLGTSSAVLSVNSTIVHDTLKAGVTYNIYVLSVAGDGTNAALNKLSAPVSGMIPAAQTTPTTETPTANPQDPSVTP
ncbi:copper amine oxidase N-terminal domain-containing protein [Cohnella sp. LGH]|uniref:copper amine oxidase N-terminal domain-containing protein n=1 Tax=Cohnella sp. LGH TaxID=1619153 RepID=UPI001ADADFEF|nr:copper amine oxidase N-terminal domain-containing protein [Cohnella sp. LGH]QTH43331.1 copper amine oxidase N-terminal domain-containing protein [Cohnella sp. LGH]